MRGRVQVWPSSRHPDVFVILAFCCTDEDDASATPVLALSFLNAFPLGLFKSASSVVVVMAVQQSGTNSISQRFIIDYELLFIKLNSSVITINFNFIIIQMKCLHITIKGTCLRKGESTRSTQHGLGCAMPSTAELCIVG